MKDKDSKNPTDIVVDAPFDVNTHGNAITIGDEWILLNPLRRLGDDSKYHEFKGKIILKETDDPK